MSNETFKRSDGPDNSGIRIDGKPVELHLHSHAHPPAEPPKVKPTQRPLRVWLWMKAVRILVEGAGLAVLGAINVVVIAGGLSEMMPSLFASRMSTWPLCTGLARYQGMNKVTFAHVVSCFLFVMLAIAWKFMLLDALHLRGNEVVDGEKWNVDRSRAFWRAICGILVVIDGVLFFLAATQASQAWGHQAHYVGATLSTLMYVTGCACFSMLMLYLADWEKVD